MAGVIRIRSKRVTHNDTALNILCSEGEDCPVARGANFGLAHCESESAAPVGATKHVPNNSARLLCLGA